MHTYIDTYIHMYIYIRASLSTVVLNSRDQHEEHGIPLLCSFITRLTISLSTVSLSLSAVSLSMVVFNSTDRDEKTWHPTFSCLHNMLHNILYLKKPTKMLVTL